MDAQQQFENNWKLFKSIVERWHLITLAWNEEDYSNEIIAIGNKAETSQPLPIGVKRWIQFIETMVSTHQWLFRDSKAFLFLPDHDALTLLVQGENDYYWAVKRSDLHLIDPPVHGYREDFEMPKRVFVYDKQISNSVSAFALKYMLDYHYMFKSSGGYSTGYIDQQEALRLLRKDFSNEIEIEDYHLFELPSIIAILSESQLHVEYKINPTLLPHSLKEYSTQKSSFSGEQLKE